jgi:hypothetical protein
VGSLEKRIEALEGRIPPPKDDAAEVRRAFTYAIMDEYSALRWYSGHTHVIRDGKGRVPIEPANKPANILGQGYTTGQLWELAIRRVFERELEDGALIDEVVAHWTRMFKERSEKHGFDWHKVEDAP